MPERSNKLDCSYLCTHSTKQIENHMTKVYWDHLLAPMMISNESTEQLKTGSCDGKTSYDDLKP